MNRKYRIKDIFVLFLASLICAVGLYFIMIPSHIVIGSASGIAMVLANFIPLSVSVLNLILNLFLLLLGYLLLGKEFGWKTAVVSILVPGYMWIFEQIVPNPAPLTGEPILNIVVFILVLCFGQAMLFRINASSGGLDVISKLLNKYLYLDLGRAVTLVSYAAASASLFAYDRDTVVLSLAGTYFVGIALNSFMSGFTMRKKICIISQEHEKIVHYIQDELHRGASLYKMYGARNMEERIEINVILEKDEYARLLEYLQDEAPDAFITCYSVNDVYGKWNTRNHRSLFN